MALTKRYETINGRIRAESTGGTRTGYLPDALGSVTATVQDGAIVNTYRYKPYGTQLSKTGSGSDPKATWIGQWGYRYDQNVPLYYLRLRHYSPQSSRFGSTDPIWPYEASYLYVNDRPIYYIDYYGLSGGLLGMAAGAALVDGPLPIGDIVAIGLVITWGITEIISSGSSTTTIRSYPRILPPEYIGPTDDVSTGPPVPISISPPRTFPPIPWWGNRSACKYWRDYYHKVCNDEKGIGTSYSGCDCTDGYFSLLLKTSLWCACCLGRTMAGIYCLPDMPGGDHPGEAARACENCEKCASLFGNDPEFELPPWFPLPR